MLVPCLLLPGAGWYFSRRPDPFRLVITEVKVLPVTPLEVSKGYDTKVSFKTHIGGIPDAHKEPEFRSLHQVNLRLAYKKDGKTYRIPFFHNGKEVFGRVKSDGTKDKDEEQHICLLRLAKVPVQYGQLNLNISAHGEHFPPGKWQQRRTTSESSFSLLLRRKGQKVIPPTVSRKPPFALNASLVNGVSEVL